MIRTKLMVKIRHIFNRTHPQSREADKVYDDEKKEE
jgi:hypothetical protein